jgi:hypothetical protein
MVPLSPCLTIHGKYLIMSATLSGLREALQRSASNQISFLKGDSIAKGFRDLPYQEAAGLHFLDTARFFELGYECLLDIVPGLLLQAQIDYGFELAFEKLPPVEKISPYLTPMAGAWFGDQDGLSVVSRSFGIASLTALAARGAETTQGLIDLLRPPEKQEQKPR